MQASKDAKETNGQGCCACDCALAFLLLRGWLGVRALLAGLEKFGAYKTIQQPLIDPATGQPDPNTVVDIKVKFYSLANYSGIPSALPGSHAFSLFADRSTKLPPSLSESKFHNEMVESSALNASVGTSLIGRNPRDSFTSSITPSQPIA